MRLDLIVVLKIFILLALLLFVFLIFRFSKKKDDKRSDNLNANIVDLEKDPESDEYKPKK